MTLHRTSPGAEWREVEVMGKYPSGQFLCREVGRHLPGVFGARLKDLREVVGTLREAA